MDEAADHIHWKLTVKDDRIALSEMCSGRLASLKARLGRRTTEAALAAMQDAGY